MTQLYNANTAASVTATAQQILLPMIRQIFPTVIAQSILGVQPMSGTGGRSMFYIEPKFKSKYKFSREWYVAEYKWMHHDGVIEWCTQQFGPHPNQPDAWSRWHNAYSDRIHFRDEKDYAWFILRWS